MVNFTTHPGETVNTKEDGTVVLNMRNGNAHTFSKEEWKEHCDSYEMDVHDMVDCVINEIKDREIVSTSEMIDYLLDIRKRGESIHTAAKQAVTLMMSRVKEG